VTKKYKDVDIEAVACVHNLQYSSVQFSTVDWRLWCYPIPSCINLFVS